MKIGMKRVPKKYRHVRLIKQYIDYFNEYRNAGIRDIGQQGEVTIHYLDGRDVALPDVLSWVGLFDKLSEMHPKKRV